MTQTNILADGRVVGHVEETFNPLTGHPWWEWECYRGGSGLTQTKMKAIEKVRMSYKHGYAT